MVIVKGVDDNFDQLTHVKDILFGDGTYSLHAGNLQYGIMGIRLAAALGTGARFGDYLRIYAPQKKDNLTLQTQPKPLWLTRSYPPEWCLQSIKANTTRTISSRQLPLPVTCLDSKDDCLRLSSD